MAMRELLPARRKSWTQKANVGGQTCYLTVGEYADGRPGELFVDVAKQGTFLQGIMATLARTVSISLQCGATVDMVVHALRGGNYPPHGDVQGSPDVEYASSVTDWIAQELDARYGAGSKMTKEERARRDYVEDLGLPNEPVVNASRGSRPIKPRPDEEVKLGG